MKYGIEKCFNKQRFFFNLRTIIWWRPSQDPSLSIFTINYCFQIKQTSLICIQTFHFLKSFIKEKFGSVRDESIYSDLINKHQQD